MTAEQLRNSILQEAISGRLVPQDPNDEPASVLLQHIREEKARLVKEGKLKKKDLAETPITAEEIPFEIPASWGWIKLKDLFHFLQGIQVDKEKQSEIQKDGQVRFLRIIDYTQGNEPPRYIEDPGERYHIKSTDLVMIRYGSPGLPCRGYNGVLANNLFRIIPYSECVLEREYTYRFFTSPYFQSFCNAYGVALSAIKFSTINEVPFPLPPLAEQKRIVAKLEELLPIVEQYGKAQKELDELNAALPARLRQSILQEAISGRLVPQDPNDEPASALLVRIREEKARLVKEGKLKKKDLVETPITDDEKPFEIPDSWEWVRLNSICDKIVDGDHNPPQGLSEPTEYLMISSRNINNNKLVNLDCVRYLSKEVFDIENLRTTLTEGDILFTSVGSLGRSCVYLGGRNLCFQRSVSIIHTLVYNYWLKYFFDSNYYQSFVIEKSTGTAQVGFYLNQLSKSLIAVPPLAEQQRIVAKIEELFAEIDKMK